LKGKGLQGNKRGLKKTKVSNAVLSIPNPNKIATMLETLALLENKLREEWSAPHVRTLLTAERLEEAALEFSTLAQGVKVRLLLSLLSLPVSQLALLWTALHRLLQAADVDADEWVRVVAGLVRRRLPASSAVSQASSQAAFQQESTEKEPLTTDLAFDEAVAEIAERIEASRTKWPREGDIETRPRMSAEFTPLEWPFLCRHLLPHGIEIDDVNRHFKSSKDASAGLTLSSEDQAAATTPPPDQHLENIPIAVQEAAQREFEEALRRKQENRQREMNGLPPLPVKAASAISSSLSTSSSAVPTTSSQVAAANGGNKLSDGVRKLLADPSNDKLTDEAKAKVVQFFEEPQPRTEGEEQILLKEVRTRVDASLIQITQTWLKLDYNTRKAKKVKSNKKVKLKAT